MEISFQDTTLIINSLPGILYLFDNTGKFLLWNKNLETISGYSSEEIAEMHPIHLFKSDDIALITNRIETAFLEGNSDAQANFVSKSGKETPYYFTVSLIEIKSIPCLIGMGIDISEKVLSSTSLRESENDTSAL